MIHSLKIFFLKKFRLIAKSIGKMELKIIHYIKFLEWKKIKNYKNLKIEEKFFQFDEEKNESYIPKKTFKVWDNWTAPLPNWMNEMVDAIEEAVNEVLPEPEQEAVVCYPQACQRGMEDRGIPWRSP